MFNWRTIIGLVLLLAGMNELYSIQTTPASVKLNYSPTYIQAACIIWMAVGVFLIIKGLKSKSK
jgi:hypothetical protein